jgi:DNA-binding GntR family transcriptional regulator
MEQNDSREREWLEGLSVEEQELWLADRDRDLQRQADDGFHAEFAAYAERQYRDPKD